MHSATWLSHNITITVPRSFDASLDGSLQFFDAGSNNLLDFFAVLVEEECGHGADVELLGDLGEFVDVEFVESGVFVDLREPMYDKEA